MKKASLHINLLGTSFSIAANEDPLYLESLLARYRKTLSDVSRSTGIQDPLKLSIMSGILLCDELEKPRHVPNPDSRAAEELTLDLIARIDEIIPPGSSDENLG